MAEESYQSLKGYEGLDPLSKFGKFLMENLRDVAIRDVELLMQGHWKASDLAQLQSDLQTLTKEQQDVVRRCVIEAIDNAMHDYLFKLQEQADFENSIQIFVDGVNVEEASDGIHGELFGKEGWMARFSAYGEPPKYKIDDNEVKDALND